MLPKFRCTNIFRIPTAVFILTMSLFLKVIETKLVAGLHAVQISSLFVKLLIKYLIF